MNRRNEVADRVPVEVAMVHRASETAGGWDAKVRSRQMSRCFSFFLHFPFQLFDEMPRYDLVKCLFVFLHLPFQLFDEMPVSSLDALFYHRGNVCLFSIGTCEMV